MHKKKQDVLDKAYKEIKSINSNILNDWRVNDTLQKVLRRVYNLGYKHSKNKYNETT